MRSCILCENACSACAKLRNSEENSNSLRKDQHNGQRASAVSRRPR